MNDPCIQPQNVSYNFNLFVESTTTTSIQKKDIQIMFQQLRKE